MLILSIGLVITWFSGFLVGWGTAEVVHIQQKNDASRVKASDLYPPKRRSLDDE